MHFKQAETLEWIEQMQAAMAVVVDQCGDLRKQLPSARDLPPPPKVELPPKAAPEKPTLAKRLSMSRAPPKPVESSPPETDSTSILKPLSKSSFSEQATESKIPLSEISDAQRILSGWKESKAKVDEIDGSMNEVLTGMRQLRLSPRLGEATRQLPPPPDFDAIEAPAPVVSSKSPKVTPRFMSATTSAKSRVAASPARGKPESKTDKPKSSSIGLRHTSKEKTTISKSPAHSRPDVRGSSRDRVSKSPASSRPTAASTSRVHDTKARLAAKSPARPHDKSPAKSRASELAAARLEARKSSSASRPATSMHKPPDKSPLKSRTTSGSSSSSSLKKETTKRPSALKEMMAKSREQKSFGEVKEEVEIFVSPKPKAKPTGGGGGSFDYAPKEVTPDPLPVSKPKPKQMTDPSKEVVFTAPQYFTAQARVVVRNDSNATADEVGELSKGDVAKCDMSRGDYLRVVDMAGWEDLDKTLADTGAWILSRNKVKEMMVPASDEDAAQVESLFNEQQQKKIEAATPPPKRGKAASPRAAQVAAPPVSAKPARSPAPSSGDEVFSSLRYFTSDANSLIRNGAESSADEVGQVKKGEVICCDKRQGDWLRVVNMFGLVDPDPKNNTLDTTGAWILSRNKVKEMMVPVSDEDAAQVENTFNEQQQKKIEAATPPPKRGKAASPRAAQASSANTPPPPPPSNIPAVKTETYPKFFKTLNKCTVRLTPDSGGDELAELQAGRVIKCLNGSGDWARATSLPEVSTAMSSGSIPNDVTYDYPSKEGSDKGMWLLIRNKKREMLVEVSEEEGEAVWLSQGGVDLYGGSSIARDMESEAAVEEKIAQSPTEVEVSVEEEVTDDIETPSTVLWYEVISRGKISLRSIPSSEGEDLGMLRAGDQVACLKKKGDWMFVKFPFQDDEGASSLVSGAVSNTTNASFREGDDHHVLEGWVLSKIVKRDTELFQLLSPKLQSACSKKYAYLFDSGMIISNDDEDEGGGEEDDEEGLSEFELLCKMKRKSTVSPDYGSDTSSSPSFSPRNQKTADQLLAWPRYFVVMSGPLHLHSTPGVGGRIIQELKNGDMIKAIGERGGSWLEIELIASVRTSTTKTAFLSKSKSSSRSIIQVSDMEAEKQWLDQD